MKFVIAPDSFKGSLSAFEVANAMAAGMQRVFPTATYDLIPMADGGEGTVEALVRATKGRFLTTLVHNPWDELVPAQYGVLGDGQTAVIEMAAASGIQFITEQTANPLVTTTYGTGELIKAALNQGVQEIIIGLGGSATIDGGAGMAQALGARLLTATGTEIPRGGGGLNELATIDLTTLDPRLATTKLTLASDVVNPLIGEQGAAAVFGPQKGATPAMVKRLNANLTHYAEVIKRELGKSVAQLPGAGAAGGLGAGLLAFTNANLQSGIEVVLAATNFRQRCQGATLVLTGEGGLDFQTSFGKAPAGVAKASKEVNPKLPVIALAGQVAPTASELYQTTGIDAMFATPTGAKDLPTALKDAREDIAQTAESIGRVIKMMTK